MDNDKPMKTQPKRLSEVSGDQLPSGYYGSPADLAYLRPVPDLHSGPSINRVAELLPWNIVELNHLTYLGGRLTGVHLK